MRQILRRLAVLAVVAGVTALAACGGSSGDAGGSGSGPATLTMWTFKQSHVAGLRAAARAFKQKTGTTVNVEVTTPQEAYITKLQAAARTKDLPDLLTVGSTDEAFKYAAAGILQDATDHFDASMQQAMLPGIADASKLSQLAIDNSKADPQNSLEHLTAGHWYGIPYVAGASGIVIGRKPALDAAAVDAGKASGSWEGLVQAVKATHAKSASHGGIVTGMQIPETAYQWLYRPMSFYLLGKQGFLGRQGKQQTPSWTSPESIRTFRLYDEFSPYWAPGVLSLGIDQADQAFAQGKAAWDVGGTYTLPFLLQQGVKPKDLVMFPVPAAAGSKISKAQLAATPILSSGVTTQSKHPQQAFAFAKFLATGEGAKIFARTATEVPASSAAADELASNALLGPVLSALKQSSGDAFNGDDFSADPTGNPPIKHVSAVALAKLVSGKSTPEQVAQEFADAYKQAWSRAGG